MPRISIVTPVSGDAADSPRLLRTLRSVVEQTGVDFEHLLVGRQPGSVVRELLAAHTERFRFIPSVSNEIPSLVNAGLQAATGDFAAWLMPGDVYYRDTLRVVADTFAELSAAEVVFGDAVLFDDRDVPRGRYRTKFFSRSRLQTRCCLCQPAVFFRRELIERHGGLATDLTYWADYDYWLRLADADVRFERTPQLLAGCEVPTATGTIHLGPFARDVSIAATSELNALYKRRRGRVPARWLVHAGRVAAAHDPHLPAESVPHFVSTLKHARAEAARHNQSAWGAPAAWLLLPIESAASEWRRLRRDPHPVNRLLAVDRRAQEMKQSLAESRAAFSRRREALALKRRDLTEQIQHSQLASVVSRVKRAGYALADAWYQATAAVRRSFDVASATVRRSFDIASAPARRFIAHCAAQSKRRIFKLKNYDPRPLQFPAAYRRTKPPAQAPQISVVTPNLNQGPFLEATIRSVVDQGYPNVQFIIQDGGSKDESLDVIRRFHSQIAHWASEKDSGQANAINLGMRHATGEIMAYLNSDDILLPGSLAYVGRYFAEHPDVDVVYGHRVLIDETGADIGRWVLPPHDHDALAYVDYVPQETMFWRKRIWDQVGSRLDEAFHFAMDWDLILRFRAAGAKFERLPRFLGAFRISADNKTTKLLETVGRRDMEILRKRVLGRIPDDQEIHAAIRPYLQRHWLFDKLYLAGVLRY